MLEADPALGVHFLRLLRSPDSPDAQKRIFLKTLANFTADVRRVDFGLSLAGLVGAEQEFLRALEERHGEGDLGLVLEHLSLKDAAEVQRLAKKMVSERLRGWSERGRRADADAFCVEWDLVKDPAVRAELTLLKELELVGQDIRRGRASWARVADVLRMNPYLNITKGLVCDAAASWSERGGRLGSGVGPGLGESGISALSVGPYGI